jgi:hypothetical protein
MSISEKEIQFLEEQIPEQAQAAITQAYWQTLASGLRVVEQVDDQLVESFPDGSTRIIRPLRKAIPVPLDQSVIRLKK